MNDFNSDQQLLIEYPNHLQLKVEAKPLQKKLFPLLDTVNTNKCLKVLHTCWLLHKILANYHGSDPPPNKGRLLFTRLRILLLDQIKPSAANYIKRQVFLLNYSSTVTWYWVIASLLLFAAHIQLLESKQKVIGVKEQPPVASARHGVRDLPRSFNLSKSQESRGCWQWPDQSALHS